MAEQPPLAPHLHTPNLSGAMNPAQAATKLTEELEAIFDTELLSGVLTDKTRGVLHRTRGVLTGLLSAYEKKTQRVQQLDTELDDAVKSRLSFDSLGSMSMWPSHFAEKATLEHLAQENKELRHKIDSSQAMTSYRNMLRHWDERSTVYVGPDRAIAKVCNQLAFENQKQAEQIASMSAQLSMSGNASAADAMLVGQATSDPGYEWRRQHAVEGDIPEVQQGTKDLSSMTLQLPTVLKAAKTSPNGQEEPSLDVPRPEESFHREGEPVHMSSGPASQAVPRSITRRPTASRLPCHPLPPLPASFHPARLSGDALQPSSCRQPSMAEPQAHASHLPKYEPEPKAVQPLPSPHSCLHQPRDSSVDHLPHRLPNHTHTQQAVAPWGLIHHCSHAPYPSPPLVPLPPSAGPYCPSPYPATGHCNGYGGHAQSFTASHTDYSDYPNDYHHSSSFHHDATCANNTGLAARDGYPYDGNWACADYDYGYSDKHGMSDSSAYYAYYGYGNYHDSPHQNWHADYRHEEDFDDLHDAGCEHRSYCVSSPHDTCPTWAQLHMPTSAHPFDQATLTHFEAQPHEHTQQDQTDFPGHRGSYAQPTDSSARNSTLVPPAENFEFPCADLCPDAETPRLFLRNASTPARVNNNQDVQADWAGLSSPADACQSCVPQGSSNSQEPMFFGVDFATLSACSATAQQASWEPAPSAVEDTAQAQQPFEQPQDTSKVAEQTCSKTESCDDGQALAGSDCAATQMITEDTTAHQCISRNDTPADCGTTFIHFGVDVATVGACHATAQQATRMAASSAADIPDTEQASITEACAKQSPASPPAVSSTPPAARQTASSRERSSTTLPSRRRRRHRARRGSTANSEREDTDTSCQAAPVAQGNSSSCSMNSGGNPSPQRPNPVVAQHASSRSTAQQCVHESALPAGQSAAGQQPRPSTNHRQAGTAASLAVRHDRIGHIAVITNGRSISDCTDRLQLTARAEGVQNSAHRSAEHQHAPSAVPPQNVQVHAESQPSHGRTNARNTAYRRRRRQRMQGSASSCS